MIALETVVGTGAAVYGVGMSLSPLLQVRAMVRARSSQDQSVGYYWVLIGGFVWWVAYGIVASDPFVLIPNVVALVTGVVAVATARYYRRYHQPPTHRYDPASQASRPRPPTAD